MKKARGKALPGKLVIFSYKETGDIVLAAASSRGHQAQVKRMMGSENSWGDGKAVAGTAVHGVEHLDSYHMCGHPQ